MKPPVIGIRRAEARDADALHAVYSSPKAMAGTLQLPFPSVEMWRKRLAEFPADDYMLVAEANGDLVGNAGLHSMGRSARRRHVGYLGMAVRDDWHGRGVGSALMAAIVDVADNWLGYRRLELTVYTDNAVAFALYRKFGFEIGGHAARIRVSRRPVRRRLYDGAASHRDATRRRSGASSRRRSESDREPHPGTSFVFDDLRQVKQ